MDTVNYDNIVVAADGNYMFYLTLITGAGATATQWEIYLLLNDVVIAQGTQSWVANRLSQYIDIRYLAIGVTAGSNFKVRMQTTTTTMYYVTSTLQGRAYTRKLDDLGITTFSLPNNFAIPLVQTQVTLTPIATWGTTGVSFASNTYTITIAGLYEFGAVFSINSGVPGGKLIYIVNGGEWHYVYTQNPVNTLWRTYSFHQVRNFAVNDVVYLNWADGGTSGSTVLHNLGYIRRLRATQAITMEIPSQAINQAGTLTRIYFGSISNTGSLGVTVSATTTPTASPAVGLVTVGPTSAAIYEHKITFTDRSTGTVLNRFAVTGPGGQKIVSATQNGWNMMSGNFIEPMNGGQTLATFASRSAAPSPATNSFGGGSSTCFITPILPTYRESCGSMTLTNDNCRRRYIAPYTSSPTVPFPYTTTLPGIVSDCRIDGFAGPAANGRGLAYLQFKYVLNINTVTPTASPSIAGATYVYDCQYVNNQGTASSARTTTLTPSAGTYTAAMSLQNQMSCLDINAAISSYTLTFSTPNIRYTYACVAFRIDAGNVLRCLNYQTTYESDGAGDLVFIDRIGFGCPLARQALAHFALQAGPSSTQRYNYTCCRAQDPLDADE